MSAPEFPFPVRLDTIGTAPRVLTLAADERQRAALAARFGLQEIARLEAEVALSRDGDAVLADGRVAGEAVQSCVATGGPVPARVDAPFALRFVPEAADARRGDEVELDAGALDTTPYSGGAIDLGEAVAQEFGLALDPFPRSPEADAHLRAAGVLDEAEAERLRREDSPFAVLKALKKD